MNYKFNYSQWDKQEISAINKVIKSGYLTMLKKHIKMVFCWKCFRGFNKRN